MISEHTMCRGNDGHLIIVRELETIQTGSLFWGQQIFPGNWMLPSEEGKEKRNIQILRCDCFQVWEEDLHWSAWGARQVIISHHIPIVWWSNDSHCQGRPIQAEPWQHAAHADRGGHQSAWTEDRWIQVRTGKEKLHRLTGSVALYQS